MNATNLTHKQQLKVNKTNQIQELQNNPRSYRKPTIKNPQTPSKPLSTTQQKIYASTNNHKVNPKQPRLQKKTQKQKICYKQIQTTYPRCQTNSKRVPIIKYR